MSHLGAWEALAFRSGWQRVRRHGPLARSEVVPLLDAASVVLGPNLPESSLEQEQVPEPADPKRTWAATNTWSWPWPVWSGAVLA
jgi:hypothetical protein